MSPTSLCDELVRSGQCGPIGLAQEDIIHPVYEERLAPVLLNSVYVSLLFDENDQLIARKRLD
jgi:hypothetical protein